MMIGPPGCGKSMLAKRFSALLPALSADQLRETARIHSIMGINILPLIRGEVPFRAPHHVISDVGLIGGGSMPRPGEISLAHLGVLFLDEFPEFRRSALEALRAPLENGCVLISRAKQKYQFPAKFQLLAAMNPCPCGRRGADSAALQQACSCSASAINSYLRKVSQPILDRIDIHIELQPVGFEHLLAAKYERAPEDQFDRRLLVSEAQREQLGRQGRLNRELELGELTKDNLLSKEAETFLLRAAQKLQISARNYVRLLRVARTVADLEKVEKIAAGHIAEALNYRLRLDAIK